jgi:hypothetical protein
MTFFILQDRNRPSCPVYGNNTNGESVEATVNLHIREFGYWEHDRTWRHQSIFSTPVLHEEYFETFRLFLIITVLLIYVSIAAEIPSVEQFFSLFDPLCVPNLNFFYSTLYTSRHAHFNHLAACSSYSEVWERTSNCKGLSRRRFMWILSIYI